jgi:signal transduction histidine kinase
MEQDTCGKMSRLLHKPLKVFIVFALLVMAASVPFYYQIIESIWRDEIDERNLLITHQISERLGTVPETQLEESIRLWNHVNAFSSILPSETNAAGNDSVYNTEREIIEGGATDLENFRGLRSRVKIRDKMYVVTVETNTEEASETVTATALASSVLTALLVSGLILLNTIVSRRIWKPFYTTIERLREYELNGNQDTKFDSTDILEFQILHQTLDKLLKESARSFRQQSEFAQNASHELQTPLAILRAKIDLLIQDPRLTGDQRNLIDSLSSALSRVTHINRNLLLLATIENKEFASVDLNFTDLISNLCSSLGSYAQAKEIRIVQDLKSDIVLVGNKYLTEVLAGNLIVNAVNHSAAGSEILVKVSESKLIVSNSGHSALDGEKLFKRFSASDVSQVSSGLGLAIVKEICARNNWSIAYDFTDRTHSFVLLFPEFRLSSGSYPNFTQ